jgi:hypothetical protein
VVVEILVDLSLLNLKLIITPAAIGAAILQH